MKLLYRNALFLALSCLAPAVHGYAMGMICNDIADCTVPMDETCEEALVRYDFSKDCCMTLTDGDENGCILTITPFQETDVDRPYIDCSYNTRYPGCQPGDILGQVACLPGGYFFYDLNFTTVDDSSSCPESKYVVKHESYVETLSLELTLMLGTTAASTWNETGDNAEFESLTANFAVDFFAAYPDLGYYDIESYVILYPNQTIVVDEEEGSVTLYFLQVITWRTNEANTTASSLLSELYDSIDGKKEFIKVLQSSSSELLSSVSDTSAWEPLGEDAEDMTSSEPGEKGPPGTLAPLSPSVTRGQENMLEQENSPANVHSALFGFVVASTMTLLMSFVIVVEL